MNTLIKLVILASIALPLSGQNIFESIEQNRRLELADAYYEAGQRFQQLGQKERGAQFIASAQKIYPGYKPSSTRPEVKVEVVLPEILLEGTVDPLTGIPDRPKVREQNINGEKIVGFQFAKLIRGFLSANETSIGSVISENLAGPGFEQGLTNAEVVQGAKSFFESNTFFTRWSPSRLFDMSSIVVFAVQETPDYILSATTNPENREKLMGLLPFWGERVSFYFIRRGDNWFLAGLVPN